MSTENSEYTERLVRLQQTGWKRRLKKLDPYRWHIRHLQPGFTLEVGCGIGRMLGHLDGNAVGLDHNAHSVETSRRLGYRAFTPEEFRSSEYARPHRFDSLLLSHVAEHLTSRELLDVLRENARWIRPGGRVILFTPQERGHASDATHVEFMDFAKLTGVLRQLGCADLRTRSFPFPRWMGRYYIYNEFVVIGTLP